MLVNKLNFEHNKHKAAIKISNPSIVVQSDTNFLKAHYNDNLAVRNNAIANIAFGSHKLVETFKMPHYYDLNAYVYQLSNKQTVVIVPKKDCHDLSINTVVKTGSFNEPDSKRGISHFLEHLAFDGSRNLKPGEFVKLLSKNGSPNNAETTSYATSFFFELVDPKFNDISELLKAHADVIKYPSLPPAQFKKEKEVVINEINLYKDSDDFIQFNAMLKSLFGIKSTSDNLGTGSDLSVKNISRKDVFAYHRQNYSPENIETYIVGDVEPAKIIKLVDKYFNTPDFQPRNTKKHFEKIKPIEKTEIKYIPNRHVVSSSVAVGFAGPKNNNIKEIFAVKALLSAFNLDRSSRLDSLLDKIDTESDVYYETVFNEPSAPGIIAFKIDVSTDKEQLALNYLKKAFLNLKSDPITQEELDSIKKNMLNFANGRSETSNEITTIMQDYAVIGGYKAYKNQVDLIKNITLEDINSVADKYLDTKKASVVILSPKKHKEGDISFGGKNIISTKYLKEKKLDNNVHLVINDNPNTIRTTVHFNLSAPVKQKAGVAEILAIMLDSSTAKHTQRDLSKLKIKNSSDTGVLTTDTGFLTISSSMKEDLPATINIINEMLFSPNLSEQNFNKAKRNLMIDLDSQNVSAQDLAMEIMYADHPLGQTLGLLQREASKVTYSDVLEYYNQLMNCARANIAVTGPISAGDNLLQFVEDQFKSLKTFSKNVDLNFHFSQPSETKIVVRPEKGLFQTEINQLFNIDTNNIKNVAAISVLDNIIGDNDLNGRLFADLREKQKLAYSVGSSFCNSPRLGQEVLEISTDIKDKDGNITDNIQKSLECFEKHINKLIYTKPSVDEVENAKRMLKAKYFLSFAKSGKQNSKIIQSLSSNYGLQYYNKLMQAIDDVTPDEVQRVAKEFLSKPSVISIITSKEAFYKAEKFLKSKGSINLDVQ